MNFLNSSYAKLYKTNRTTERRGEVVIAPFLFFFQNSLREKHMMEIFLSKRGDLADKRS